MDNKLIGISGVARSGKDTFAAILKEQLQGHRFYSDIKIRALAYQLKKDLKNDILEKFSLDVFTNDSQQKDIIRPYLVAYGKSKRIETFGQYWTSKLQKEINSSHNTLFIITDIRYAEYDSDEYQWLKRQRGLLVHITRYNKGLSNKVLPPNEEEALNDPILESFADFNVVWPTTDNKDLQTVFVKEFIRKCL